MPVSGVNSSNDSARIQAQRNDDAKAEAVRRQVEADNQRAAQQQQQESSRINIQA